MNIEGEARRDVRKVAEMRLRHRSDGLIAPEDEAEEASTALLRIEPVEPNPARDPQGARLRPTRYMPGGACFAAAANSSPGYAASIAE
jgi:hypothetical protein